MLSLKRFLCWFQLFAIFIFSLTVNAQKNALSKAPHLSNKLQQNKDLQDKGVVEVSFDGRLVNWAFVNKIAPDPVLDFEVLQVQDVKILRLTVLKRKAIAVYDLTEPPSVKKGMEYAGYRVLAWGKSKLEIHGSGEDWPFFGDSGAWVNVETEMFLPEMRRPKDKGLSRLARSRGLIGTLSSQISVPRSSEGLRAQVAYFDAKGIEIDRTSGTRISSQSSEQEPSQEDLRHTYCDREANNIAQQVKGFAKSVTDPLVAGVQSDAYQATLVGGGLVVGGLATGTLPGAAAGGTVGYYADMASKGFVGPYQAVLTKSAEAGAFLGAYGTCMSTISGVAPGTELQMLMSAMTDNPAFDNGPPSGATLWLVCVKWSEGWDEAEYVDGGIEVIYHTPKCVQMEPQWIEE